MTERCNVCGCDLHADGQCPEECVQLPEWSGSLCPIAPDTCWIDDETGEHVSAITGIRSTVHPV